MERIWVRALVTGQHSVSGLALVKGEKYEIDKRHFGDQVMELTEPPAPAAPEAEPTGGLTNRRGSGPPGRGQQHRQKHQQ